MSITATSMDTCLNGDTRAEVLDFLFDQASNEALPLDRRNDYRLAFDLITEGPAFTRDWPAARAFIIKMTEGLL